MSNQLPRAFTRALVLALFVLVCFSAALAQTPSPTPVNPATQPPGQPQIPPATAPPGTQTQNPQTPPGTTVTPMTPQPTPVDPNLQEPRQPNFPDVQAQPVPPLPDLTRVGVVSSNVLTLSMNDAIRQALQNNNDIEVAKDDVRFAETATAFALRRIRSGIQRHATDHQECDSRKRVPSLGAAAPAGTTSVTTFNLSPSLTKSFEKGGGNYTLSFPIRVPAQARPTARFLRSILQICRSSSINPCCGTGRSTPAATQSGSRKSGWNRLTQTFGSARLRSYRRCRRPTGIWCSRCAISRTSSIV